MNILYVENYAPFATIAVKTFLGAHAVTVIPSLEGARQLLATGAFDLVLVDFDLDDGKGDTQVAELCAEPTRPRIVAVSSHKEGNAALVRAGADAFRSKAHFGRLGDVIAGMAPRP